MSPSRRLAIVTATLDVTRATPCMQTWTRHATVWPAVYGVQQLCPGVQQLCPHDHVHDQWVQYQDHNWMHSYCTSTVLGVVPAFAIGVQKALEDGAEVIACLHDDLEILRPGWDEMVLDVFAKEPQVGLVGFGGGTGLGAWDIYRTPYNPMQLARQDFVSNMVDAEAHGRRSTRVERVACLDGFSQIGRREFWEGQVNPHAGITTPPTYQAEMLFSIMQGWGVTHHFYDGMLGCFAKRLGWEVLMLPVACRHYGGRTAVGDARYAEWALTQDPRGDGGFWDTAHRIGYEQFRDVLPIRTR